MPRGRYLIVIKDFGCWLQEEGLGRVIYPVSNCLEELLIDLGRYISIVLLLIGWQRILRGRS
jgi:hypothetical protein